MIYLDHNATSPLHPVVKEALKSWIDQPLGNPSSVHGAGRKAREILDRTRRALAENLQVHDSRVIFTSGGTEANNMLLFGVAARYNFQGHIITSAIEHPAVLEPLDRLEHNGMQVSRLRPDAITGQIDIKQVIAALRPDTKLISLMHANNETGAIQPIEAVGALAKEEGILFHVDAVQSFGKLPLNLAELKIDALSLSAHKLGGMTGFGALVVEHDLDLMPLVFGGGQERKRRSGTENLLAAATFLPRLEHLQSLEYRQECQQIEKLRDDLLIRLKQEIDSLVVFAEPAPRLANTILLGIPGLDGETLVMNMDLAGVAISSGSACASGKTSASHVLSAMQVEDKLAKSAVRISLGWNNRLEDIEQFMRLFKSSVTRLNAWSGLS
ncbi:cysteine desulfurase family protein [Magnetococcales bacterium HHB-1]